MARTRKLKGPESVGAKEIFGVTALSTNNGFAAIFMSTMFMTFMTDYAGLGKMGATLATVLLLAARVIDAVDDPIQGFIMDRGKIAMQGTPREIFGQVERMKELQLDVPQVTLLAHELRQMGIDIPVSILTKEELADALMGPLPADENTGSGHNDETARSEEKEASDGDQG